MAKYLLTVMVALLMTAPVSAAESLEAKIDGKPLPIALPAGSCALGANSADAALIEQASSGVADGGASLIGLFADCTELADWRAGKRPVLDHYGQVLVDAGTESLDGTRAEIVAALCQEAVIGSGDARSLSDAELASEATKALTGLEPGRVVELGVIAEEPNACYSASASIVSIGGENSKNQVGVLANGVIGNRLYYVMTFAPLTNAEAIARSKSIARDVIAATP